AFFPSLPAVAAGRLKYLPPTSHRLPRPRMAQPSTDRNLLFGVLALQLDFVSQGALVAAMNAWVLDKARPLGQVLLEQGALVPDPHARLEARVEKHLALRGGADKSLAAAGAAGGAGAVLRQVADADVQTSLGRLSVTRDWPADPYATRAPGPAAPAGPRFRVL